jgi:HupE / UreJ protein
MKSIRMWWYIFAAIAASAVTISTAVAHDTPNAVSLHAFVKPEGERLHLLIRIPLVLLGTLDLPRRGPGFIDLPRVGKHLELAAAIAAKEFELRADGEQLVAERFVQRITPSSDDAFQTYARALELIHGPPLPADTDVHWKEGYFDVHLEYPIRSERSDFTLDVQTARDDRVAVDVRFLPPQGDERLYVLRGPAASVALDPSWQRALWVFVKSGVAHILEGYDHLLFLLCMVMPFRRLSWSLVGIITSFTVAHTITLFAAAFNLVPTGRWFPPFVEVLIALSIIYMAIENLIVPNLAKRWLITGIFGLVHGLGFSFALRDELKFAGDHLVLSLVAFNAGIEIGQFIVLALLLPMLALIARWPLAARYTPVIVATGVVATASFWLFERAVVLANVASSVSMAEYLASAVRVVGLLLIIGGVGYWLISRHTPRGRRSSPEEEFRAARR